jgi:hypothetical protein
VGPRTRRRRRGRSERVTDRATLERLAAWAATWDGRWKYRVTNRGFAHPDAGGRVLVFAVRATKIIVASGSPFSQTRYLPAAGDAARRRDSPEWPDRSSISKEHQLST